MTDATTGGGSAAAANVDADAVRRALLDHYDAHRRELPWRDEPDPYRVWVSEVMLQQTRVETVVPYYERWLERFPSVHALADADEHDVLKEWEGLGYYSRARNLHRAARVVRERYGGRLPAEPTELRRLPGIGEYTAGAVASIAFGVPAPAVDGNVRRVLARLFDLPDPAPAELRRLADLLVPADRPGDFNQAVMELGATVCSPRSPQCGRCPIGDRCAARANGTAEDRPRRKRRAPVPEVDVGTAVLVRPDGRALLVRRPADGLLGGMWEFPGSGSGSGSGSRGFRAVAWRAACGFVECEGEGEPAGEQLGTVAHTFSHRRIRYHAFRFCVADATTPATADAVWVEPPGLQAYALPVAQRKIARLAFGRKVPDGG